MDERLKSLIQSLLFAAHATVTLPTKRAEGRCPGEAVGPRRPSHRGEPLLPTLPIAGGEGCPRRPGEAVSHRLPPHRGEPLLPPELIRPLHKLNTSVTQVEKEVYARTDIYWGGGARVLPLVVHQN